MGDEVQRTYSIPVETVERLEKTALRLRVGRNDLVRFLLHHGLGEIDAGRLEVPTKDLPRQKRITLK